MLIGVIVNTITVIICSLIGMFLVRGIPQRFETIIKKAIGLSTIFIGISGALQNERIIILVMSMVFGSIIGELIDIDRWMTRFGMWAESKLGFGEGKFTKGFVTASILFCTGSMAIVGAMQSGLSGDHEMLYAKSILDGSMSIVFASTMGVGVVFSAITVFVYEGAIALGAGTVSQWMTAEIITEMSAAGSLVITGIGFNFLEIKQIKVANMIPAIFMPWLFIGLYDLLVPIIQRLL